MKLYLMQHGNNVGEEIDRDKPLSDQGRKDVELIAQFLAKRRVDVQRVFHSGKTRAKQSAEMLMRGMGLDLAPLEISGLSPMDTVKDTADMIRNSELNIMLVGHLPHLSKLSSFLISGNESASIIKFQQGGLVCLEKDDENWSVAWMLVPRILYLRSNK